MARAAACPPPAGIRGASLASTPSGVASDAPLVASVDRSTSAWALSRFTPSNPAKKEKTPNKLGAFSWLGRLDSNQRPAD